MLLWKVPALIGNLFTIYLSLRALKSYSSMLSILKMSLVENRCKDAEWIASLLQHGLLQGSFVPDREQRELRELVRYRKSLIEEKSRELNRIQKVLEGANIKLSSVVSDINGASSRSILEAIINGEENPETLAELSQGKLKIKWMN
ncbi:transposase IS111A/IS1328/IS1533 [Thermoanaerobacter ethanolicus JW 200]|nr:transposase IS111A/IS1328/IS1533 [Thermoanaerobacter ethanolicus JW 200]